MICGFVSETSALFGNTLNKTTPDPRNGSTHLSLPVHSSFKDIVSYMNLTSFVFIPCVFIGGTLIFSNVCFTVKCLSTSLKNLVYRVIGISNV